MSCVTTYSTKRISLSFRWGDPKECKAREIEGVACPPNDVGGIHGYKEMLRVIKEEPDGDEAWEYYTWLGSKWEEKFFPAIDIAIALNEVNHHISP